MTVRLPREPARTRHRHAVADAAARDPRTVPPGGEHRRQGRAPAVRLVRSGLRQGDPPYRPGSRARLAEQVAQHDPADGGRR